MSIVSTGVRDFVLANPTLARFGVKLEEQFIECQVHTRLVTPAYLLSLLDGRYSKGAYRVEMQHNVYYVRIDRGGRTDDEALLKSLCSILSSLVR